MNAVNDYIGYIEYMAIALEIVGVLIILGVIIISLLKYLLKMQGSGQRSYEMLREDIGKGIILGLEILIGGDIVATVTTEPTMDRVLVLGAIVIIRTVLSLSIEVEIEGNWPWNRKKNQN